MVTLDVERAQDAAAAADDALARGDDVGPLHGLPMTIKDAIETEGIRSTGGAVELAHHVPAEDAPAVARLKNAGAVVFGKTNLPRFSGDSQAFNDLFGTTNNPWSFAHVPGGSSGGSAAALAAGLTGAELGTDIGGSVRAPAHCCGVYAHKPSYGVIPNLGYLDHVGGGTTRTDINTFGPMARSADDLALLLAVLTGPVPDDEPAWRVDLPPSSVDSLAGLRVATWLDDEACSVDAEYLELLRAAADALADAGARVEDAHPDIPFREQSDVYLRLVAAAVSPGMPDDIAEQVSRSHLEWLRHDEERAAFRRRWAEWFQGYDVLLAPAWCTPPFEHDHTGDMTQRVGHGERRAAQPSRALAVADAREPPQPAGDHDPDRPHRRGAAGRDAGRRAVSPRPACDPRRRTRVRGRGRLRRTTRLRVTRPARGAREAFSRQKPPSYPGY